MIVVLQRGRIYKWARVIKSSTLRIDNDLSSENDIDNGKRCGVFRSYLTIISASYFAFDKINTPIREFFVHSKRK